MSEYAITPLLPPLISFPSDVLLQEDKISSSSDENLPKRDGGRLVKEKKLLNDLVEENIEKESIEMECIEMECIEMECIEMECIEKEYIEEETELMKEVEETTIIVDSEVMKVDVSVRETVETQDSDYAKATSTLREGAEEALESEEGTATVIEEDWESLDSEAAPVKEVEVRQIPNLGQKEISVGEKKGESQNSKDVTKRASSSPSIVRKVFFALTSFLIGAQALLTIDSVSQPAFDNIIRNCSSPDFSSFQAMEPKSWYKLCEGLYNFDACLITKLLLELRQSNPAGLLSWTSFILVFIPVTILHSIEPGRKDAKKFRLVSFPIIGGLLYLLLGVSVAFPLFWVPSYIFGRGRNGPVSTFRANLIILQVLLVIASTFIVFFTDINSNLWNALLGIHSGHLLVMSGVVQWFDKAPTITEESVGNGKRVLQRTYNVLIFITMVSWFALAFAANKSYDFFGSSLKNISHNSVRGYSFFNSFESFWTSNVAGAPYSPVKFISIETCLLYMALIICIAFQSVTKAVKALVFTPLLGPAAAPLMVMKELERLKSLT